MPVEFRLGRERHAEWSCACLRPTEASEWSGWGWETRSPAISAQWLGADLAELCDLEPWMIGPGGLCSGCRLRASRGSEGAPASP
ncbi:hypothetical protein NDU88_001515 [Pleurodeles waltl]|uniref:Uncharacterized protein n=1 Tax=Pleurodeles waltl TaxID=8319 RepID=A0AAV7S9Z1_PLEWA|nr:hypothetical protein NDU88_001515 [Pleurodeles waltl]